MDKKPSGVKKMNIKKSERMKGSNNPMWGKHHSEDAIIKMRLAHKGHPVSEETKLKLSLALRGKFKGKPKSEEQKIKQSETMKKLYREGKRISWNAGKPYTQIMGDKNPAKRLDVREKIKLSKLGEKNSSKRLEVRKKISETVKKQYDDGKVSPLTIYRQNPELRERLIKAQLKGLSKRPTSLEKQMIEIIQKYNLPYKYVGDGSLIIGYKNPDFVNTNGEKICVDVRSRAVCTRLEKISPEEYKQQRKEHFAKYGWESIVFWDTDMPEAEKWVKEHKSLKR